MKIQERSRLCDRIIVGYNIISYNSKLYYIYDPDPNDLVLLNHYYTESYENLIMNGFPTEQESLASLIDRKIWDVNKEQYLSRIDEEILSLRETLPNYEYRTNTKNDVLERIENLRKIKKRMLKERDALVGNTAEYLAESYRNKKLLFLKTTDFWGNPLWKNWEAFCKDDSKFINGLIHQAFFKYDLDEKVLRELARNEPWRTVWLAGRKVGNLFPRPVSYMTVYQRSLVSWSLLYDSVYESMDCPDDDIIQNDDLLDQWLIEQSKKRKSEKSRSKLNIASKGDAQEIGIPVETVEDARKVYELNDPAAKRVLQMRSKFVQEKGHVHHTDLPDIRKEIMMKANRHGK